jgi:hypothetical protein
LLDLHTSEAPITTTRNDVSIEDLGLEDMIVDGILNLFAVVRRATPEFQERAVGKKGIYLTNNFWVSQTPMFFNGELLSRLQFSNTSF